MPSTIRTKQRTKTIKQPKKLKKPSLTDYIEENQKLISVLGVFAALSVFSLTFSIKAIGYVLSFVFLTLTVIVWIELWTKFPKKPVSGLLSIFEWLLMVSTFGVCFYWLLAYRDIWEGIMVFVLWIILLSLMSYPISRFKLIDKIFGTKLSKYKIIRILFGLIIVFILLQLSIIGASFLAKPVNTLLEEMQVGIDSLFNNNMLLPDIPGSSGQ